MTKTNKNVAAMTLGALGIVFGDIGTSPLYALNALFGKIGYHLPLTRNTVFGVVSLIIWSITIVVSIKFVGFIMRADNKGEGGILALVANILANKSRSKLKWALVSLGLLGVALFYGDSTITPAISVLSAVEGLKVVAPALHTFVIPCTLLIIFSLFFIQKFGTGLIGHLFGPIMVVWFSAIGFGGAWQVWLHPRVLIALSPFTALHFFISSPLIAFTAMGAVVLAITGAEALYADMGHFGRAPITKAWFFVVFPSLLLCYMGEGTLLLHNASAVASPFILLYPAVLRLPIIILSTVATIIASQSVISGAFSLTRQAVHLNLLPKLQIRHTSAKVGGQIYVPLVNSLMLIVVVAMVLIFGSSARLANAYGVAVSGTLAIDTLLYLAVMRTRFHASFNYLVLLSLLFVPVDLLFVTSSIPKILKGGWLPLFVGLLVLILITTWRRGQRITSLERKSLEGPLEDVITRIQHHDPPLARIPGTAIYITHHADMAPLALHATIDDLHELHEQVIIVSVEVTTASHVPEIQRIHYSDTLGGQGVSYVHVTFGYHDVVNVPESLAFGARSYPQLTYNPLTASYFVSIEKIIPSRKKDLSLWRKHLYSFMMRNSLSPSDYYKLPFSKTIEMSTILKV